jgi:hypothetical protein
MYDDADGNGSGARIQFALLAANPAIASVDFVVV